MFTPNNKMDPEMGAQVYDYQYVELDIRREDNEIIPFPVKSYQLLAAQYIGRNGSWRYYRNQRTGREWKENGMYWHLTEEIAYDFIVEFLAFQIFNGRNNGYKFYLEGSHPLLGGLGKIAIDASEQLERLFINRRHRQKQTRKPE
jgi:hypothetical protein